MVESTVIDAHQLQALISTEQLIIIDVSSEEEYNLGHIEGAIRVDPSLLNCSIAPVANKLPSPIQLSELFSSIGLTKSSRVIAYDHQLGALAGRFIWTLHIIGHRNCHFLNGQYSYWAQQGLKTELKKNTAQETSYQATIDSSLLADVKYLLEQLNNPDVQIWDARSHDEFIGHKVVNALKGGHIPGAKNLEWTDCLRDRSALLLSSGDLLAKIAAAGLDPSKEIVTHCQTHRRSGLTYIAALHAGIENIRCYDGSWFEWGNLPETPVER